MKKIINFIEKNIKLLIAFILGITISVVGVFATSSTLYDGDVVSYDSTNSGLELEGVAVDNVQDAIDALYEKSMVCREDISTGCPGEGCYYSWNGSEWYTTWNTQGQTPTTIDPNNLPSGVSTNYNDVKQFNMFIAMRLNSSNQVEHAYACGIENGTPFCIEGYSDGSKQQDNINILTPIFSSCSGNVGSDVYCHDSLGVVLYSYGYARVKTDDEDDCTVLDYGGFRCIED